MHHGLATFSIEGVQYGYYDLAIFTLFHRYALFVTVIHERSLCVRVESP